MILILYYRGKMEQAFYIRKDKRHIRILRDDIQFVTTSKKGIKVVTSSQEWFLAQTIVHFSEVNAALRLMRIHRSYLVNFDCVDSFDSRFVYIGRFQIPIGSKYGKNFPNVLS